MLYLIANGPMPTTAAQAVVTTGTAIKTMLQLKPFNICKIIEWGFSMDGSAAATPGKVELCDTGTIFGTVTASADVDIYKMSGRDQAAASVAGLTLGTSATGYTCTSEGSITTVVQADAPILLPPTGPFFKQIPLGREYTCIIGNAVRIRCTFGAAINAYCYMILDM